MLFIHSLVEDIALGRKTQTRRPIKRPSKKSTLGDCQSVITGDVYLNGRLRYKVGADYAVQSGRGKPCVLVQGLPLRIVIDSIRQGDVRRINEADLQAEGSRFFRRDDYIQLWAKLYDSKAYRRWLKTPQGLRETFAEWAAWRPDETYTAWVLTFHVKEIEHAPQLSTR